MAPVSEVRMKISAYTATVTIDPERRELVGSVRLGRDGFSFRGRSFGELERACARSVRTRIGPAPPAYAQHVPRARWIGDQLRALRWSVVSALMGAGVAPMIGPNFGIGLAATGVVLGLIFLRQDKPD